MRHGPAIFAAMWTLALIAFGGFFAIIGLAVTVLGGPDTFAMWLPFGLLVMAVGVVALAVIWRKAR